MSDWKKQFQKVEAYNHEFLQNPNGLELRKHKLTELLNMINNESDTESKASTLYNDFKPQQGSNPFL